jgi:hypothetical protein
MPVIFIHQARELHHSTVSSLALVRPGHCAGHALALRHLTPTSPPYSQGTVGVRTTPPHTTDNSSTREIRPQRPHCPPTVPIGIAPSAKKCQEAGCRMRVPRTPALPAPRQQPTHGKGLLLLQPSSPRASPPRPTLPTPRGGYGGGSRPMTNQHPTQQKGLAGTPPATQAHAPWA